MQPADSLKVQTTGRRLRGLLPLLAVLACACSARADAAAPMRVMSLNLCSDELVLTLVPPGRITSVTVLARDVEESYLAQAAARVPVNRGTAEEVLRQRPDVVIAGTYTTPATRALLTSAHVNLVEVAPAETFAQIRAVTRTVGVAVGESARAEELIARMDAQLAWLASHPPEHPFRVAAWDGGGSSPGRGTLYDTVLEAAGGRNVMAEEGYSTFGTEELLRSAPDLLLQGASESSSPGRRDDVLRHPLVLAYWRDRRVIIPQALYTCGTPFSSEAAMQLRRAIDEKAAVARQPLPFLGKP
jgi:iron complex transport system substrate-binding protein